MKTKSVLVASFLTLAIAMPAWSDTLLLRNGRTLSGTLIAANRSTISFQDRSGRRVRYSVSDVDAVQFGDGPYNSGNYGRPENPVRPVYDRNQDNRNDNRYQENRDYGQSRMERVVLPVGTEVSVRTNERIDSRDVVEGQTFSAQIEADIRDTDGSVAIPRGSDVWLVTRRVEVNGDITLDVDSISVAGRRYRVSTTDEELQNRRDGLGGNARTGKYVGGGAVLGAIIGAIAGGGKGAAIGAGVGAGAGAGTQVLTRGKSVNVPAESLLTFRLQQPLQTGFAASSDARRYKPGYNNNDYNNSAAYRAGLAAGRSDSDRNLARNSRTSRWTSAQDRRDYQTGYDRGYDGTANDTSINNNSSSNGTGSIHVGSDNNVTWQAPAAARVYVRADNDPEQLFADGQSGTQAAPWIMDGHTYLFMLRDQNGNEIARDRVDLRRSR